MPASALRFATPPDPAAPLSWSKRQALEYEWIGRQHALNLTERAILQRLLFHRNNQTMTAWTSIRNIAAYIGVSHDTVQRGLKRLAALGYLTIRQRAGTRMNEYLFPDYFDMADPSLHTSVCTQSSVIGTQNETPVCTQPYTHSSACMPTSVCTQNSPPYTQKNTCLHANGTDSTIYELRENYIELREGGITKQDLCANTKLPPTPSDIAPEEDAPVSLDQYPHTLRVMRWLEESGISFRQTTLPRAIARLDAFELRQLEAALGKLDQAATAHQTTLLAELERRLFENPEKRREFRDAKEPLVRLEKEVRWAIDDFAAPPPVQPSLAPVSTDGAKPTYQPVDAPPRPPASADELWACIHAHRSDIPRPKHGELKR